MWGVRLTWADLFPLIGIGGFVHELAIHDGPERPFIIAASLAFAGLRWTLPTDLRRKGDE